MIGDFMDTANNNVGILGLLCIKPRQIRVFQGKITETFSKIRRFLVNRFGNSVRIDFPWQPADAKVLDRNVAFSRLQSQVFKLEILN